MARTGLQAPGAFALLHYVAEQAEVSRPMARLAVAGGRIVRSADVPPHCGFRGYVANPDDHAWEIAWNPAWTVDAEGHVHFGL